MSEAQAREIEKVLLHLSDARLRARKAADALRKDGAQEHLIASLCETEAALAALHRKLSQDTYYAVPDDTMKLAV